MEFEKGDVIQLIKRPHGSYIIHEGSLATVLDRKYGVYLIKVKCEVGRFKGETRNITIRKAHLWALAVNEE